MRYIMIFLLLMIAYRGLSQQGSAPLTSSTDKALVHSNRVGNMFGLERSKTAKLYHIDRKLEQERARVPQQFKDSVGQRLAYGRLERARDEQYQGVLTKEQYKEYRLKKRQLAQ